jgi:hypothetical protein
VGASDSLNTANRAALDKQPDDLSDLLGRQVSAIQLLGTVTVGFVALATTKPLIPLAVASKPLTFDFAIVAGH